MAPLKAAFFLDDPPQKKKKKLLNNFVTETSSRKHHNPSMILLITRVIPKFRGSKNPLLTGFIPFSRNKFPGLFYNGQQTNSNTRENVLQIHPNARIYHKMKEDNFEFCNKKNQEMAKQISLHAVYFNWGMMDTWLENKVCISFRFVQALSKNRCLTLTTFFFFL